MYSFSDSDSVLFLFYRGLLALLNFSFVISLFAIKLLFPIKKNKEPGQNSACLIHLYNVH